MSTLISCELEADSFTIIAMAAFHIKNQQHKIHATVWI